MPTKALLARPWSLAWLAWLALQDLLEQLALTVQLAHKAHRALLARRVSQDLLEQQGHRVLLDRLV